MAVTRHPLMPPSPDDGVTGRIGVDQDVVRRLRESLDHLRPLGPALTRAFYERLFTRYPGVRTLFPADMASQEKKLYDSLVFVVDHILDPAKVAGALRELGRRHVGYGAKPEHYPLVAATLVEAMGEAAGPAWTPQLAAEWSQALELVTRHMLDGAAPGPAASR